MYFNIFLWQCTFNQKEINVEDHPRLVIKLTTELPIFTFLLSNEILTSH